MSADARFPDCNLTPIARLPNLASAVQDYVPESVAKRLENIRNLPTVPRSLLQNCSGTIIDVGPGEGVSSMALAQFAPDTLITGIEMDRDHLKGAWPMCNDFPNLRLFWGALPPIPSNPRVKSGTPEPPPAEVSKDACKCSILFSWIGMSRRDIFEPFPPWDQCVQNCCVLVVPRIWRQGPQGLATSSRSKFDDLCDRLRLPRPSWAPATGVPGFTKTEVFSIEQTDKARGWLLWLTGIFDSAEIALWDTLTDRWDSSPRFQLPDVLLDLEVVVGYK